MKIKIEGTDYEIVDGTVGRSAISGNAIITPEEYTEVSRIQARFVVDGSRVKIVDNKSTNGIYIDGKRIKKCEIKPGDRIRFGSVEKGLEIEVIE